MLISETEARAVKNTDDADPWTVLAAVRICALSWEPNARIIGNVRAGDIARAIQAVAKGALGTGIGTETQSADVSAQSSDRVGTALGTGAETRHRFEPHRRFPWFCAHCGYAPHEALQHIQE